MTPPQAPPPFAQLLQLISGHWVAAAVYSAARLGLADRLAAGPRSSDELAEEVGAHAPSVYRLLRALAGVGVVEEGDERRFGLTPVGDLLRSDVPGSLHATSLFQGHPAHWAGWGNLLHAVRTGESSFEAVHGKPFFDYLEGEPEYAAAFNNAMSGMSNVSARAVVESYPFEGIETLADVGGGHGVLLSQVLAAHPAMRGVLFDLPQVVEGAPARLEAAGVADRVQVVGGSFFEGLPGEVDAFIAKHIIHDWDDDHCRRILEHMRAGLREGGRVLIVEHVIEPGNAPQGAKMLDLEMLHATRGGKERTRDEFVDLFEAVGLRLERIVPTASGVSVLEARRAG